MFETSLTNKRISKNTLLLYFRMIFMMLVSLYTSRVILEALGVEDFGVYNVVGGVVSMFGFLNSAMSSSTQRYITFELGRGVMSEQQKVFTTSVQIHMFIALIVVLLGETVGLWFLENKMVIDQSRHSAAFWVFQCSVLTMAVSIISVPYNAIIIAHEKMSAFAYISVVEVVLKLCIVFLLLVTPFDKLIFYAVLLLVVQLMVRVIYGSYCNRHFKETKLRCIWDKSMFKEMMGFAGWNLIGNCASILSTQGVNILLNIFFGPTVNAARGVAVQVQNAVLQFSQNFQTALNPQITKNYAKGDREAMYKLIIRSSRFSFFLLFFLSLPIFLMTQEVLELWLKRVPDYSAVFLKISLMIGTVDAMVNPLMVAATATGHVRHYQTIVGGVVMLITPVAYVALKLGAAPPAVFVVHFIVCVVAAIARIYILKSLIGLSVRNYVTQVGKNLLMVILVGVPLPLSLYYFVTPDNFLRMVSLGVVCMLSVAMAVYSVGMDVNEKKFVTDQFVKKFNCKK